MYISWSTKMYSLCIKCVTIIKINTSKIYLSSQLTLAQQFGRQVGGIPQQLLSGEIVFARLQWAMVKLNKDISEMV